MKAHSKPLTILWLDTYDAAQRSAHGRAGKVLSGTD